MKIITSCFFCLLVLRLFSQTADISPALTSSLWKAQWIDPPGTSPEAYGVYHFRKTFYLAVKPSHFVVHVSGDNRYRLFVNGTSVCFGPARGDLQHWRYETVDIAPYLVAGKNVIASVVWNFADLRPWAQISLQTGFILQGNSDTEEVVNTDSSWKVYNNMAYRAITGNKKRTSRFMEVGPGEEIDGSKYPWGWETPGYDDTHWHNADEFFIGTPNGLGTDVFWWLVPRTIPMMEETQQRIVSVRRSTGITPDKALPNGKQSFIIPPATKVSILFDQDYLTNAYPQLIVSKGKGSTVKLTYAEALYDSLHQKGNRNEIEGKSIAGNYDIIYPDGGSYRKYSPLWFRTFRYLQMDIETRSEPLVINDFYGMSTAYPFRENASFASNDTSLNQIWDVGWRTARLCAYETYFDCPYYEQLQYIGDTRIQALISLYVSGDDRLMRNAISLFDNSRFAEGLTASRYPTTVGQVISPFSLVWVNMVHDYWMHRDDPAFVEQYLQGIKSVLYWFESHIDPQTGMIGAIPYWSFVDWPDEWPWDDHIRSGGVPAGGQSGNSSIITLQTVYAMEAASELFSFFEDNFTAHHYRELAVKLKEATLKNCWNDSNMLMADSPGQTKYSQHAQVFAVLTGAISGSQAHDLMERTADNKDLIQCTVYFRFYLYRAMKTAGLGNRYIEMLQPWRNMIAMGLTTFPERPEPTRSDCHAWSASPNYELLASVCGIEPNKPGFTAVRIEPNPGSLTSLSGTVPHPLGSISVSFHVNGNKIQGTIHLPSGLPGIFVWRGNKLDLHGGENSINF